MFGSDDSLKSNGDELPSCVSVDGLERQNSGTGWCIWTFDTVALLGLGKVGML